MAWPLGALIDIVREVYAVEGNIRGAARQLGIGIGTVQDILANPDRPRRLGTFINLQSAYESFRPRPEPGPFNTTRLTSDNWLPSQVGDIIPPRGATGWLISYKPPEGGGYGGGFRSTGWVDMQSMSFQRFVEDKGLSGDAIGEIRFGRRSAE